MTVALMSGKHLTPRRHRGAALVIGLLLLLAMTIVGVAGMRISVFGLTMVTNAQIQQNVFQAAETGIDITIQQPILSTTGVESWTRVMTDPNYSARTTREWQMNTPVPGAGFSMGVGPGSIQAWHFDVRTVAQGPDDAQGIHNQSYYIIGPGN